MAGIGRRSPPNAAGIPESSDTTTTTATFLVNQVATTDTSEGESETESYWFVPNTVKKTTNEG